MSRAARVTRSLRHPRCKRFSPNKSAAQTETQGSTETPDNHRLFARPKHSARRGRDMGVVNRAEPIAYSDRPRKLEPHQGTEMRDKCFTGRCRLTWPRCNNPVFQRYFLSAVGECTHQTDRQRSVAGPLRYTYYRYLEVLRQVAGPADDRGGGFWPLGPALAGRAGARLASVLGMPVSRSTILPLAAPCLILRPRCRGSSVSTSTPPAKAATMAPSSSTVMVVSWPRSS